MVGVNRFRTERGVPYQPLQVDPSIEEAQARRLLDELGKVAASDGNVLFPMWDALRARASVGQVCDALRKVWGTHVAADVTER